MRSLVLVSLTVATVVLAADAPPDKPEALTTPTRHVGLAAAHLVANMKPEDYPYTGFVSFHGYPEKQLPSFRRTMWAWLHQMSWEDGPLDPTKKKEAIPVEVPGSDGRLYSIDFRDYGWNQAAWQAVCERDVVFQEPLVHHEEAEALRKLLGLHVSQKSIDAKKFPVLGIAWAPQLFRDTIETDRGTTSYYDLLFARQRFVDGKEEWRTESRKIEHKGGVFKYPDDSGRANVENASAGTYNVELRFKEKGKKAVDFPKNETELNLALGLNLTKQFTEGQKIDLDFGAIVAGGTGDAKGSVIARNDRLLVMIPTIFGTMSMKSFDVAESTDGKDYVEQLIFKGGKFVRGKGVQADADAHEILWYLPNGGQGAFITDGKDNRLEVTDAAHVTFTAVKTPGDCVVCHAPASGFNAPANLFAEMLAKDIDIKFADREQRNRTRQFFLDWSEKMDTHTKRYAKLIAKTTATANEPGWTPAVWAKEFTAARTDYDAVVTTERAAMEWGVSVDTVRALGLLSPKGRLAQLSKGMAIPRRTFEKDTFFEGALLISASRK